MHRLVVVVLVTILEEAVESIFQDLVDGGLASTSGSYTHESVTNQLSLIQLNDLANLEKKTNTHLQ